MAIDPQCEPAEQSEWKSSHRSHLENKKGTRFARMSDNRSELTCQSYNYVIAGKLCELNNRTKEAKPGDFVRHDTRFYVRRWKNRGTGAKRQHSL